MRCFAIDSSALRNRAWSGSSLHVFAACAKALPIDGNARRATSVVSMSSQTRKRLSRIAIALFALWLPLTMGQGAKATTVVADALYAAGALPGSRPHLSCHMEHGKDCCCKNQVTIRAAECGCHDGESSGAPSCGDPTLPIHCDHIGTPAFDPSTSEQECPAPYGRTAEPPDPPPPTPILLLA
jgi:hypothetical protein